MHLVRNVHYYTEARDMLEQPVTVRFRQRIGYVCPDALLPYTMAVDALCPMGVCVVRSAARARLGGLVEVSEIITLVAIIQIP